MGGGDLNLKKSWHPNTAKNQRNVWKAEQIDAAEKRKLAELQKEISDERNREELKRIGQSSGVLKQNDNKKLEWMYRGGQNDLVNREEYLLGRVVDKTFEKLDAQEKKGIKSDSVQSVVTKNHVEHECIPFSIRQFKGEVPSMDQVDLSRKLMEDPVMAIKQKEMESRRKILENPVKLKELHRLLKNEQGTNKRKHKKSKKKSKKNSHSTDSDEDLDKILAAKYKKIQGVINHNDDDDDNDGDNKNLDINKILSMKYNKLNKELDKISKKHKKKSTRNRDSSEDPESYHRNSSGQKNVSRRYSRSPDRRSHRNRTEPYHNDNRNRYDRRERYETKSSRQHDVPGTSYDSHYTSSKKRSYVEEKPSTNTRSSSSESSSSSQEDNESSNHTGHKNFGLTTASGKQLKIKKLSSAEKAALKPAKIEKPKWQRPAKLQLTDEEKEQKRLEMLSNAGWRDQERERNMKRYRDEEEKETAKSGGQYDRNFLTKQLKKATRDETVESRIKSKINNIQRSGHSMNENFARR